MATNETTISVLATIKDEISSGVTKIGSTLEALKAKTSALNSVAEQTPGHLNKIKTACQTLDGVATQLNERLDQVAEKLGDKLVQASKKGLMGITALGVGIFALSVNIQKELETGQDTLVTYLGGATAKNIATASALTDQMRQNNWLVDYNTQVSGMKQLMVNPLYRPQAANVNQALVNIAAGSPGESSQTYTQLANMLGRAEQMGRINGRVTMFLGQAGVNMQALAQSMGINDYNTPEGARVFDQMLQRITTPQQLEQFIVQQSKSPAFASAAARYQQTLPGAEAYAKTNIANAVEEASNQKGPGGVSFGQALQQLVAPLTTLARSLTSDLVPPLTRIITGVVQAADKLMPLISPLITALGDGLVKALGAILKVLSPKVLTDLGNALGNSLAKAITAITPLLPTLMQTGIALLALLPPLLTLLIPAFKLLITVLNPLIKLLNGVAQVPAVQYTLAGIAAAMLAIMAYGKVRTVLLGVRDGLKGIAEVSGLTGEKGLLTKIKGIFTGGGKATGAAALDESATSLKGSASALTAAAEKLSAAGEKGALGGGGGPGAVLTSASNGEGLTTMAEKDANKAVEGGIATKILTKLFPRVAPKLLNVAEQLPEGLLEGATAMASFPLFEAQLINSLSLKQRQKVQNATRAADIAQGRTSTVGVGKKTGKELTVPGYEGTVGTSPLAASLAAQNWLKDYGESATSAIGQDFIQAMVKAAQNPANAKAIQDISKGQGTEYYDPKTHTMHIGQVTFVVQNPMTEQQFEQHMKKWGNNRNIRGAKQPTGNAAGAAYQNMAKRPNSSSTGTNFSG